MAVKGAREVTQAAAAHARTRAPSAWGKHAGGFGCGAQYAETGACAGPESGPSPGPRLSRPAAVGTEGPGGAGGGPGRGDRPVLCASPHEDMPSTQPHHRTPTWGSRADRKNRGLRETRFWKLLAGSRGRAPSRAAGWVQPFDRCGPESPTCPRAPRLAHLTCSCSACRRGGRHQGKTSSESPVRGETDGETERREPRAQTAAAWADLAERAVRNF